MPRVLLTFVVHMYHILTNQLVGSHPILSKMVVGCPTNAPKQGELSIYTPDFMSARYESCC